MIVSLALWLYTYLMFSHYYFLELSSFWQTFVEFQVLLKRMIWLLSITFFILAITSTSQNNSPHFAPPPFGKWGWGITYMPLSFYCEKVHVCGVKTHQKASQGQQYWAHSPSEEIQLFLSATLFSVSREVYRDMFAWGWGSLRHFPSSKRIMTVFTEHNLPPLSTIVYKRPIGLNALALLKMIFDQIYFLNWLKWLSLGPQGSNFLLWIHFRMTLVKW